MALSLRGLVLHGHQWFSISAIRASIMISTLLMGRALYRPTSMFNSLFAAAFLILAWIALNFSVGFSVLSSCNDMDGSMLRYRTHSSTRSWMPCHYTPCLRSVILALSAHRWLRVSLGGIPPILWFFFTNQPCRHATQLAAHSFGRICLPWAV